MTFFTVVLQLACSFPLFAVIGGEPRDPGEVGTVELQITHEEFSGAEQRYVLSEGTCSGVVVGRRPLTVLTAAHCFYPYYREPSTGRPRVKLRHHPVASAFHLAGVAYNQKRTYDENAAADLAVVWFDHAAPPDLAALPIGPPEGRGDTYVCGFGFAARESAPRQPTCARRALVADPSDFSNFIPNSYADLDPRSYESQRNKFLNKRAMAAWDTLVAINRLRAGEYAADLPMPRLGDSGGPWITFDEDGRPSVFALVSFGELFKWPTRRWPAFRDPSVPLDDLPYAYFGVRLNTPEARALLSRARAKGADLGDAER